VRDLAIDGHDLMHELLILPGPELGRILRALLEEVLDDPQRNEREMLLGRAREIHAADADTDAGPDEDTGADADADRATAPRSRRGESGLGPWAEELPHPEGE
jgi:hypothetical protein